MSGSDKIRVETVDQLVKRVREELARSRTPIKQYGPWTFDRRALTLTHKNGYSIDVEEWTTSAEVLDWIFQIYTKDWGDQETIFGLVCAIEDTIDPQGSLCSSGHEQGPIDVKEEIDDEWPPL